MTVCPSRFLATPRQWLTIADLLTHRAMTQPDQTVYVLLGDGEQESDRLTYQSLAQKAQAIAARLQTFAKPGDRALLLYPPGLDYIAAFFGCLYAGVVAVPAYPPRANRSAERVQAIAQDAQATVALTTVGIAANATWLKETPDLAALLWLTTNDCDISAGQISVEDRRSLILDSNTLAFLQYTSGSTGTPKGVMVSHGNLLHNLELICTCFGNTAQSRGVTWLPPYHDMGLVGGILQPLYVGASTVLMSPMDFLRKPINWLRAVSHYQATTSGGPNFAYDLCVQKITPEQRSTLDLSHWEVAFNGAEPVRAAVLERFAEAFAVCGFRQEAFYPCYGMAETTLLVSGGQKSQMPVIKTVSAAALSQNQVVASNSEEEGRSLVGCGQAAQRVAIVNPESQVVCAAGQVGEIWVAQNPSLAQGYWQQPEQTRQIFYAVTAPEENPEATSYLRTGDLGFVEDGELFVTGRLKDVIIVRGQNHYPQDIELTVEQSHGSLRKPGCCAAFAIEVEGEERLVIVAEVERRYQERRRVAISAIERSGDSVNLTDRRQTSPDADGTTHQSLDVEQVVSQIRQAVAIEHGLQVHGVVLLSAGSIPKTSSGKIQRYACRSGFLRGSLDVVASRETAIPVQQVAQKLEVFENLQVSEKLEASEKLNDPTQSQADDLIQWLRNYGGDRINSFLIDERRCIPPHIVLDFGNRGLLGMQVPQSYGGIALSHRSTLRILQQLGAIDSTLALFVGLNNVLGIRPILNYGSEAIREEFLPKLATGRELAAFALTEPGAGSNPQALSTQAVAADGTGSGLQLYGTKIWSGSAAWAGVINVFAQHLDANGKSRGVSAFAVRQGSPGLRQGAEALTMGMRGMVQNTVYLEGVPVASEQILGEPGNGMEVAQDAMMYGRLSIAAACVGGMKRCAQLMVRYADRRMVSTGRLLSNPVTLVRLNDLTAAIATTETLVNQVAEWLDRGVIVPIEVYTACKIAAPEFFWQAADNLVQLLGGRGYIETNIAPQLLRDARILRIFEGPTETLNMFLGSRVVHQGQGLTQFLSHNLGAADLAQRLQTIAQQIQQREETCGERFGDRTTAQRWAYVLIGEITTQVILLASVRWAFAQSRIGSGDSLGRAVAWAQIQLEQQIERAGQMPTAVFIAAEPLKQTIADYGQAIGEVEQTLADENRELDELLRHIPCKPVAPEPITSQSQASDTSQASTKTQEALQNWIMQWLERKVNIAVSEPSRSFAEYGLDSVTAVEFAHELQQMTAPLEVEANLIWHFPTIAALSTHLATELQALNLPSSDRVVERAIDLHQEAVLDIEIAASIAAKRGQLNPVAHPKAIFLTGSTGFLGAFLLADLLRQTQATCYCLVRAADIIQGIARIQQNLGNYGLWDEKFQTRIVPILGDLARPQFGLCDAAFQDLALQIDVIYHSAALLNWVYPYAGLKTSNVLGTQEVIRLASQHTLKPLHYVSTVTVFESTAYAGQQVMESDPVDHSEGIYMGYSQSKWVAEKLVTIARDQGLPVTIYRPPLISGDSQTGAWNSDDFTCLMIRGCIQLGSMPDLDYRMDIAPVNYVSQAIAHLSQQPESLGKAFHLNNPQPLHWRQFADWLQDKGYTMQICSYQDWLERLRVQTEDNPLAPLLPFFLKRWSTEQLTIPQLYQQDQKPQIDCRATLQALEETAIACAPVDSALLSTYFAYLIQTGALMQSEV
ncbi:MAG: thioester reductase domain-containing protein [Drouetiella hepatica Uher 2000/2452]|jgi:thioester reductase-like protein|uniref:Thioester reductase domain-containing protein n=1 Tax=Drouetiella hepatica Uher 2000/2452 TaxID=904376 RepID=A0A951UP47_9CYAN|nr:thioester reductase domain-containing protein [Drouetiella hepatica Uher 2000/2452]